MKDTWAIADILADLKSDDEDAVDEAKEELFRILYSDIGAEGVWGKVVEKEFYSEEKYANVWRIIVQCVSGKFYECFCTSEPYGIESYDPESVTIDGYPQFRQVLPVEKTIVVYESPDDEGETTDP